ncbi:helix-turn-helix domain-containing protein [Sphingobacterium siyangense]|uniref:helix-turn-helix domain-containing protein n=1 Tax=Sphingobacterium siyangense TaxID=459529 RepID=UPI003C72F22B
MNTLGKRIRFLRQQKGWNQRDVAERLNISIPAFSKIENGITDVNLSRLNQLSKLFNLSIVQLFSTSDSGENNTRIEVINSITYKLQQRTSEIIELQQRIIDLYKQLHK